MSVGNATLTEMIWTLIGLAGLSVAVLNMRDSWLDVKALDKLNGDRILNHDVLKALAYGHVRNDATAVIILSIIALIGAMAMTQPPANPAQPISALQVVVTMGLFAIAALIVFQSVMSRLGRHTQMSKLGEGRKKGWQG